MVNKLRHYRKMYWLTYVIVLTLSLEGLLRKYAPQLEPSPQSYEVLHPSLFVPSDYLPFSLPPNQKLFRAKLDQPGKFTEYDYNSLGYRGKYPEKIQKTPGTFRLLLLGDSFTLGAAVEEKETFASQLQEKFNNSSKRVEVINAGFHDGYSPDAYYAYLLKEGNLLSPDAIVTVIYSGNDLTDIKENRWLSVDERGAPTQISSTRNHYDPNGKPFHTPWYIPLPFLNQSYLASGLTLFFEQTRDYLQRIPKWKTEDELYEAFRKSVDALQSFATLNQIDSYFILLPSLSLLRDEDTVHLRLVEILRADPNRKLLDLKPELIDTDYLPNDKHLSPKGHLKVAEAIESLLPQF